MKLSRIPTLKTVFGAALMAGLFLATSAQAVTVLAVDFGSTTAQSGFQAFVLGGQDNQLNTTRAYSSANVASGSISVTLAGGAAGALTLNPSLNQRTRVVPANGGAFSNANLMNDRIVNVAGSNDGLYLELTGLNANTQYTIQLWGMDWGATGAKAGTVTYTNFTNGGAGASMGSYSSTANQLPTDNSTFSITANVTTDAAGRLLIRSSSGLDGVGIINGFLLTPEPGTGLLLLLGAGSMLSLCRSRRSLI